MCPLHFELEQVISEIVFKILLSHFHPVHPYQKYLIQVLVHQTSLLIMWRVRKIVCYHARWKGGGVE